MSAKPEKFFAPCPRGLEPVLAQELAALGGADIVSTDGGVHFSGPLTLAWRANLESRIASRVLWRVGQARYRNEEDVYKATLALPWPRWFDVEQTLRVNLTATRSPLKSLDFTTLRIKDAVCDSFRAQSGKRPSVDTRAPDVRIHAFLDADDAHALPRHSPASRCSSAAGAAPPARRRCAKTSPPASCACRAGTASKRCSTRCAAAARWLIEAALIALDIAPGARRSFGFEKLKSFDRAAWERIKDAALAREKPRTPLPIYGSDLYGDELRYARANANAAGLDGVITLKQANVLEMPAPASSGVIVTNPPYGVRLGDTTDLAAFYPKLGDALKQKFAGWRAYILSGDMALPKLIRLAASKRTPLFNGALECRLFEFKIVAGSARKVKPTAAE